ncbi:hypothetical protein [Spirosoma fluviale]|uniref:Uncharacterized protein n=1 Tax=Spirosoma fluviale TaxID=1597977 RepID=A0A286GIZ7_9BACT|nr:hypothetical protein [Spirosoma fluviale]SOD95196.1 hypothetical protein SAMN06269250_4775 [Spirosoma fluviale]
MKITIIADSNGQVIGTIKGQIKDFYAGEFQAGPMAPEGGKLQEVEVPDEFERYYTLDEEQQGGLINSTDVGERSTAAYETHMQSDQIANSLEEFHSEVAKYLKKA